MSLVHEESEMQYINELKQFCKNVYLVRINYSKKLSAIKTLFSPLPWDTVAFYSKDMKNKAREITTSQKFDVIWINFLSMANYIDRKYTSKSVIILDQHNVDELVWKNYAQSSRNLPLKLFSSINYQKIKGYQRKTIKNFQAVACCSNNDADFMRRSIPEYVQTWLVPNGVDTEFFKPEVSYARKANIIMLCASMNVGMNIEAAYHFAKEVFPAIKEKVPDSQFWIVGRKPDSKLRALDKEGYIKVTGSVPDVRPYYNKARVIVAPYKLGGGTKLKILEAMSMNLPIVATSTGFQGIDLPVDAQIYVRDNMSEFAEAIIAILHPTETDKNGATNTSRNFVEKKYGWGCIIDNIEPKLIDLVKNNHKQ